MPDVFYKAKVATAITLEEYGDKPLPIKEGFEFSFDTHLKVNEAGSNDIDLPGLVVGGRPTAKRLELGDGLDNGHSFLQISVNPFDEESAECVGTSAGIEFWFDGESGPHWKLKKAQVVLPGDKIASDALCVCNHSSSPVTVTARWIKCSEAFPCECLETLHSGAGQVSQEPILSAGGH